MNDANKLNRLALMSILLALSLIMFMVESLLPVIPIQGVKLGFSNVITLIAIAFLGKKEALIILVMRIILAGFFSGSVMSFMFSLVGGLLAFLVMALTYDFFFEKRLWVVSVFGAICHNIGQIAVAFVVMKTTVVLLYLPILIISGIVTGSIIGVVTMLLLKSPIRRYALKK